MHTECGFLCQLSDVGKEFAINTAELFSTGISLRLEDAFSRNGDSLFGDNALFNVEQTDPQTQLTSSESQQLQQNSFLSIVLLGAAVFFFAR